VNSHHVFGAGASFACAGCIAAPQQDCASAAANRPAAGRSPRAGYARDGAGETPIRQAQGRPCAPSGVPGAHWVRERIIRIVRAT